MPTPDQNAIALSGAQFPAVQANTLAELIGSPPQGVVGGASEVLLSEWDNGSVVPGHISTQTAVLAANRVKIQAWLEYCAENNRIAFIDGGPYQFAGGSLDMRDKIFTLRGAATGDNQASLWQIENNIPLINIGETTANTFFTHVTIENVRMRYGFVQSPSNTGAALIRTGQIYFGSALRQLNLYAGYNGISLVSGQLFSNTFEALMFERFSGYYLNLPGMGTGNVFDQIHMVGNTLAPTTCHAGIFISFGVTNFMSQINIEWMKVDQAGIYLNNCRNLVFDSLNLESIDPIGNNVPLVRLNGGSFGNSFHGVKVQTCEFSSANGCTVGAIFQSDGGQSVSVDGLHIQQTTKVGSTFHIVGPKISGQVFSDVYYLNNVQIDSPDSPNLDGLENYTQDATYLGQGVIRQFNGQFTPGMREVFADTSEDIYWQNPWSILAPDIYATTPLTAARTKTLKNTSSATATITHTLNVGSRCTIIRTAAASGDFPLNINNDEDVLLVALYPDEWATFHFNSARVWVLDQWGRLTPGSIRTIAGLAAAGDEQLEGVPLVPGYNIIATATATTADGALLPTAAKGLRVEVRNKHASVAIDVWPHTGDSINGGTVNTGVLNIPSGDLGIFVAEDATNWHGVVVAGAHA